MNTKPNHKILVIDDDPNCLLLLENILSREDFQVISHIAGQQGIKFLKENGPVSVIFSDFQMPGMNGLEFFEVAKIISPDSYRVLVSADPDIGNPDILVEEEIIHYFLKKPFLFNDVVEQAKTGVIHHSKFLY